MHAGDRLLLKVEMSGGAGDERSTMAAKIDAMGMKDYPQPGPNCRHDPHPRGCPPPPVI